jgi:hypothetical protein
MHRREDGTAQYRSVNDTEGSEMLWVNPDGTTLRHIIVGACNPCEMAEMYKDGRPGCGLGTSVPMRSRRFTTPNWVRTAADVRDAWSGLWRRWAGLLPPILPIPSLHLSQRKWNLSPSLKQERIAT